jgi:hypothetical protein
MSDCRHQGIHLVMFVSCMLNALNISSNLHGPCCQLDEVT